MTHTPHGQVPEALEDHQVRKLAAIGAISTSSGLVERRPIEYRRELEDQFVRGFRAAEKRLSALRASHVQNPAENEHVAGDVSKNGAELNMSTQQGVAYARVSDADIDRIVPALVEVNEEDYPTEWAIWKDRERIRKELHALRTQQPAPATQQAVGSSGFDYKTAADFLSGKTISDEALRKFVAASRGAHDDRAALRAQMLALRGVLASREAEIALLKRSLLDAEAAAHQPSPTAQAAESVTAAATESYVQPVPDKCDRIVWRGHYYHLPPAQAAESVLEDAARLDWLEADESKCVFHLGKSWYTRSSYGMPYRKRASLRAAIDAAMGAARKQGGANG